LKACVKLSALVLLHADARSAGNPGYPSIELEGSMDDPKKTGLLVLSRWKPLVTCLEVASCAVLLFKITSLPAVPVGLAPVPYQEYLWIAFLIFGLFMFVEVQWLGLEERGLSGFWLWRVLIINGTAVALCLLWVSTVLYCRVNSGTHGFTKGLSRIFYRNYKERGIDYEDAVQLFIGRIHADLESAILVFCLCLIVYADRVSEGKFRCKNAARSTFKEGESEGD